MAHRAEPSHLQRLASQPSQGEETAPALGRRSMVGLDLDAGGLSRTRDSDSPQERSSQKDTTSRLPRPPGALGELEGGVTDLVFMIYTGNPNS